MTTGKVSSSSSSLLEFFDNSRSRDLLNSNGMSTSGDVDMMMTLLQHEEGGLQLGSSSTDDVITSESESTSIAISQMPSSSTTMGQKKSKKSIEMILIGPSSSEGVLGSSFDQDDAKARDYRVRYAGGRGRSTGRTSLLSRPYGR